MQELFSPVHIIILMIVAGFLFLPVIFYCITLYKALTKCAPESRTLEPGLVWLYVIPVVNLVFGFFIVFGLAKSLRNEFTRRGLMIVDPTPGQAIGIAMCICACCSIVPFIGFLAAIAHLVLWIVYWVKIAGYSRDLDMQVRWAVPPASL
jgi:hypothetical protein